MTAAGWTPRGTGLAVLAMAILFNMQPFFTLLLLPPLVPVERFTLRGWLGTGVAFVGVALVLGERGTLDSLQKIGRTCSAALGRGRLAGHVLAISSGLVPVRPASLGYAAANSDLSQSFLP